MNEEGLPLDQLLAYVERAARGDRRLSGQLYNQFQQLANMRTAPPDERALGKVLARILLGNLSPDLNELDPEAAREVSALLERLRAEAE